MQNLLQRIRGIIRRASPSEQSPTESMELRDGTRIEASSVIDELNIAMTWLSYPGRSNRIARAAEIDFAGSGT